MSGQKSSGLYPRATVVWQTDFLFLLCLLLSFLILLRIIIVLAIRLWPRIQKRPGPRTRYRHHTCVHLRANYVPVSCTLDPLAGATLGACIRAGSRHHRSSRFVRSMLSIVRKAAYVVARVFLLTTAPASLLVAWTIEFLRRPVRREFYVVLSGEIVPHPA